MQKTIRTNAVTPLRPLAVADGRALLDRGIAESHAGTVSSIQTLAGARDAALAQGDDALAVLATSALAVTGHALGNFRRFRDYHAALAPLRDGATRFADPNDELLANAGLLCVLLMFGQADPAIDACAGRLLTLIERDLDVNLRFATGRLLLFYAEPREQRELGQRLYALLHPLIDDPRLSAHRLGRFLLFWVRFTVGAKDRGLAERAVALARATAERTHDPEVAAWLSVVDVEKGLKVRDFEMIERALARIEAVGDPANLNDAGRLAWLNGRYALARGDGDAALFNARRARRIGEELEIPPPMLGVRLALEAQACVAVRDFAGARALFAKTAEIVAVLHAEEMRDMIRMVEAYEAHLARRPDADALLAAAFAGARTRQFYDSFDTHPRFGATMCALAIERNVEADFARRIIEVNGFAPPPDATGRWPWPVRICTLGRFDLERDGEPMSLHGKAQRKPLELLKALIAAGGRAVDKARLGDLLWPDADGDAAALDMTVSRLRKLLGRADALRVDDGKLGLDPDRVWIDVWAFDRAVDALVAALHAEPDEPRIAALVDELLSLYRGAFLDSDSPQRWMLAARDRWQNRFLRSIAEAGRWWERGERWSEAVAVYERGVETDSLAEDLYRRLMRCHIALGQHAEAARVYRRCREMLSIQLGIVPSADTEALFQSIYRR